MVYEVLSEVCDTAMFILCIYLAYRNVCNTRFRRQIWIYPVTMLVIWGIQTGVLLLVDNTWIEIIMMAAGLVVPLVWADSSCARWKLALLYPAVYLATGVAATLSTYAVALLTGSMQWQVQESLPLLAISEGIVIALLLAVGYVKRRHRPDQTDDCRQMNPVLYALLLVGMVLVTLLLGYVQGIERGELLSRFGARQAGLVFCVIALLFMGICIWQQITLRRERKYRIRSEEYERYLRQQEEHIRMLILQDEHMRRFRHDFRAHIIALEAIAEKGSPEELRSYLKTMRQQAAMDSVRQYTGLAAVDAVVGEWAKRAEEKAVNVQWEGRLTPLDRVEIFDLCIIFSNLLTNALEACEGLEENRRRIKVTLYCYEATILLTVKNTYDDSDGKTFSLESRKQDRYQHGLGIRNVCDTLKKYGGTLTYRAEEGWVTAEVLL